MQHHCGKVFWNKSLVAAALERRERSCVDPPTNPTHADKQKMKRLIWDCQKDIAAYVTPQMRNCGGRAAPDANLPARRWSGEEGVGDDWHGWWPDDNDGEDATAEPRASDSETA